MSSHQEIINALTLFYEQVTKQLSLSQMKQSPAEGWNIDTTAAGLGGKNEAVIALLQHIPYLENVDKEEGENKLVIWEDTAALDWRAGKECMMEDTNPLPAHCAYLTEGSFRDGYALILDTERGTLTEYSTVGRSLTMDYDEMEAMPDSEKWRGHRTLPAAELLGLWTTMYARLIKMLVPDVSILGITGVVRARVLFANEAEEAASETGALEEWHPSDEELQEFAKGVKSDAARQFKIDKRCHVADVYNSYLRHGWPDHFDKEACTVEVMDLEEKMVAKETEFERTKRSKKQ
ncbi:unnamed protein product [Zymoseptoria tritici ST99CH_1A5]|uniref:Uncharacterized protein n=2 Tax=Zymoseptoria tritici TaxID=1047171 RepID=A0A2H1GPX7_ZYMTR|nr:unnamed protein product [Zymoseptoria tritici ST99CH_1E4]SMY26445.1 unnamed protein product [Zymoseptoria tritici ST99CH_1A5]